ncbi:MAG: HD domain-containing protein [Pseudomonadota bacterium]
MAERDLTAAYLMAARAHAGQRRRGAAGTPYINHPCEVADLVAGAGGARAAIIAAVLHDTVEDTDLDIGAIEVAFGEEVAALIGWLTDPEDWGALPRRDRKRRQAEKIRGAPVAARMVKLADQTANVNDIARDPSAWTPADGRAYVESAAAVAAACGDVAPELEAAFRAAHTAALDRLEAVG